jgi:serine/threonine kinase 32
MHTSIAGSMAYMAPEVVGRSGYTWCIDWWSLGVTAYELLFHRRPFDGRSADKMTQSILKDPIKFSEECRSRCSPDGMNALRSVSLSTKNIPKAVHSIVFFF